MYKLQFIRMFLWKVFVELGFMLPALAIKPSSFLWASLFGVISKNFLQLFHIVNTLSMDVTHGINSLPQE